MKAVLIWLSIFAFIVPVNADRRSTGKLIGQVKDSLGAAIPNATVVVHFDTDGARHINTTPDLFLSTDRTGGYWVELPPGFYDIAVFAHGVTPNAHKVRISLGQTTKPDEKLTVDPQIVAEFGDKF